jgi:quercetin dioxygenase-like cupin family protein
MKIHRAGSRPSRNPGNDYFTGSVRFDPVVGDDDPSRIRALQVTFEPGARTHWHTHPGGQVLVIQSGQCLVGRDDGRVEVCHPGDTVIFEPDERHWHGAAPDCAMVHLAVQPLVDGSAVTWAEPVSDADYGGPRV